jgi:hypothetical protein
MKYSYPTKLIRAHHHPVHWMARVDQMNRCIHCLTSKDFWQLQMRKNVSNSLIDCPVHPLGNANLLCCLRNCLLYFDASRLVVCFKWYVVFTTIVRSNTLHFLAQHRCGTDWALPYFIVGWSQFNYSTIATCFFLYCYGNIWTTTLILVIGNINWILIYIVEQERE